MTKEELEKINSEIEELSKRKKKLELQEADFEKKLIVDTFLVKVACGTCHGTGTECRGGADIESDPPEEWPCDDCIGRGWVYAKRHENIPAFTIKELEQMFDIIDKNEEIII